MMTQEAKRLFLALSVAAAISSFVFACGRLNKMSQQRRVALRKGVSALISKTAVKLFVTTPKQIVGKIYKQIGSLLTITPFGNTSRIPRYILKLSSSCTIDERIAGKRIAADALGGEGAIAAIEEGPPLLATILVFDRLQGSAEPGGNVVGIVMLKRGWQDDEFERNVADVIQILNGRKSISSHAIVGGFNGESENATAKTITAGDVLEWIQANSLLREATIRQHVLSEALRRNMLAQSKRSQSSSSSASRAAANKAPPRTVMSSEIVGLAVSPQHRKKKLGAVLANLAAALGAGFLGMIEIQGSAANPELVPFYLNNCAPPNLTLVEADQFITLDVSVRKMNGSPAIMNDSMTGRLNHPAAAAVNRAELRRRWKHSKERTSFSSSSVAADDGNGDEGRLPDHICLDPELEYLLRHAETEPLNGGQVERPKYPL